MRYMQPPGANFKLISKSHLKFDPNTGTEPPIPQPVASMYSDLTAIPTNTLLSGPDFPEPLSKVTITMVSSKQCAGNHNTGLLGQSYRKILGAE